jgi:hypothetical protein
MMKSATALVDGYALSDQEFQIACFLRLGIPVAESHISCPSCHVPLSSSGDSFEHLCNCKAVRRQITLRHNLVSRALEDIVNRAGLQCEHEPKDRQPEEGVVPDGYIYGLRPGKKIGYDISVAHPSLSSLGSARLLALPELPAAAEREKEKIRKFGDVMKKTGDAFAPVVFETYGAPGWEARKLIKEITQHVPLDQRKEFSSWAYVHLSCALQKGNAAIWRAGQQLAADLQP